MNDMALAERAHMAPGAADRHGIGPTFAPHGAGDPGRANGPAGPTPATVPATGPVTHATVSPPALTRDDAARELAAARGNLAVLRKRAETAHQAARRGEAAAIVALDRDWALVRQRTERRGPYDGPDPVGAALVWLEAERRWLGYAASGVPYELQASALAPVRSAPTTSPEDGARHLIAALAGRGIGLHVTPAGTLAASPAGMLDETARRLIDQHRAALLAVLATSEAV